MTDIEFDVLDNVYFLQSYKHLSDTLNVGNDVLKDTLRALLEKGWLRCYSSPTNEIEFDRAAFEKDYWSYQYLASKAGLLAHNSNF